MIEFIKILFELTKFRITFFVMITTGFGFISATENYNMTLLFVLLGTLLLACGSAVFNHLQEKEIDSLMERTKNRPIPSGRIDETKVAIIGFALTLIGSLILLFLVNVTALILGIFNLIWYNLVYTPMKRSSYLAIVPGSLVGAIAPIIGWVAAGGDILDFRILSISSFFFLWQIPHFWLLMLKYDVDYRSANLPTITDIFSKNQLARIIFSFIVATGFSSILIPIVLKITNTYIFFLTILLTVLVILSTIKLLRFYQNSFSPLSIFRSINIFVFSIIIILSLNKLIS